jgi:hypothetical protein
MHTGAVPLGDQARPLLDTKSRGDLRTRRGRHMPLTSCRWIPVCRLIQDYQQERAPGEERGRAQGCLHRPQVELRR